MENEPTNRKIPEIRKTQPTNKAVTKVETIGKTMAAIPMTIIAIPSHMSPVDDARRRPRNGLSLNTLLIMLPTIGGAAMSGRHDARIALKTGSDKAGQRT